MRLWTIDPRYLDAQGLVALWREGLLARAVLMGKTRGYRHHPQLERFRSHPTPHSAISAYLGVVHAEACARNYCFDRSKLGPVRQVAGLPVTQGQIEHEWAHLLAKLASRSPQRYAEWRQIARPECHPLFRPCPGPVEGWERLKP